MERKTVEQAMCGQRQLERQSEGESMREQKMREIIETIGEAMGKIETMREAKEKTGGSVIDRDKGKDKDSGRERHRERQMEGLRPRERETHRGRDSDIDRDRGCGIDNEMERQR